MGKYRTHSCGVLNKDHIGNEITISGWVRRRRDHGGLVFIELADYSGSCQAVFKPEFKESFVIGEQLRGEYVAQLTGKLCARPDGTINPEMETGEVELEVVKANILSKSETTPFTIQDKTDAKEELRLRYRYLDLRRPEMQEKLRLRHRIYKATRSFLDQKGFCEVETPVLTKPTPEGARDFLVPSRINQGQFYALPQSPQLFKQVLMCSCLDKYFQIVKCFRDEDLRANRQPEFTQIDIEMSFVDESDVQALVEQLVAQIWQEAAGIKIQLPLPRLSYDEAMSRFGVDAPDMRFGLELSELNEVFGNIEFQVFRETIALGGIIKGFNAKSAGSYSRKELDELTEFAKKLGAKGLVWFKVEDGSLKSPVAKFLTPEIEKALINKLELESGDLALVVADQKSVCNSVLGALRVHVAKSLDLIDNKKLSFLWVEKFPLFEHSPELGRYLSVHHPFTSPLFENENNPIELEGNLSELKARAYDIVLNGQEIGGGSIRIHRSDIQSKVFNLLGISEEEASEKFGFLLEALSFGAPPHGGIALGLDRIAMIISGTDSIRDVIAFPKTQRGQDLMVNAPSIASIEQLMELGIRVAASNKS